VSDCPEPFLVVPVVTGSVHTEPSVTCPAVSPDRELSVVAPERDDPAPGNPALGDDPAPVDSAPIDPAPAPDPAPADAEPASAGGNDNQPFTS
jgi:hypothetical protein